MIIGDPSKFAIESDITRAVPVDDRSLASGFFVLHIEGRCYGVREPDATLLGCSIDEVENRSARRGQHTAPFAQEVDAGEIADAFRDAIYAPDQEERQFFGIPYAEFGDLISSRHIDWAPDGDEAFDDGSYVLHFDVGDRVRLIAFRNQVDGYHHDPSTLRDIWINANEFYAILDQWLIAFEAAWCAAQNKKTP
jgi:hypothetical protein